METIFIRGTDYAAPSDLHSALKLLLDLPDYYGMNADALYDCLSERGDLPRVWISSPGEGDVSAALNKVIRVLKDLGADVEEL